MATMFLRFISSFALILLLVGCSQEPQVYRFSGYIMGTSYNVQLVAESDPIKLDQYAKGIEAALVAVDQSMSTYKKDSELSRFNRLEAQQWFDISKDLLQVMNTSAQIHQLSGGVFDVTAGTAVNLWGFGPETINRIPGQQDIEAALKNTGFDVIQINKEKSQVRKMAPRFVDLSAVAKGFAVDQVALYLNSVNVGNYLVEVGGEVRVAGNKPQQKAWKIAVEVPDTQKRAIQKIIALKDISMATSGNYRNFYQHEGRQVGHTIDPRTASPVEHNLGSVTVLAKTCADADAWATAMMVLGEEKGFELAVEQDLAVLMVVKQGEGFKEIMSPQFKQILLEE